MVANPAILPEFAARWEGVTAWETSPRPRQEVQRMTPFSLTFDCHDARAMATFWKIALAYDDAPPPRGWSTWQDWLEHFDVPEDEWEDGASIADPAGAGPRVGFIKVPEGKAAKNRLHIDLQAAGGRDQPAEAREPRIRTMVARLVAAGGSVLSEHRHDGQLDHVTMADPEGNEFCVV